MEKSTFTDEYIAIIELIRKVRRIKDLKQSDLANSLKKKQSFVSKYERRERRLDIGEFVFVAEAFGMNPRDLFNQCMDEIEKLREEQRINDEIEAANTKKK